MPNDYTKTIAVMTGLDTFASKHKKFATLASETEDQDLKKLLEIGAKSFLEVYSRLRAAKAPDQKNACDVRVEPWKVINAYCEAQIRSQKPQWQILAEKNGWGPKE